ncbi:sugar transferase [Bacillus sp. Marseille-Q3570]|uniref:sugar transferase n=1 Tax=Bacillus sp. Marseille-Q3570 TaxID=2963522 RepID=UPI0021B720D7|nr:sugar transferase [Bacillus sp. Marseille-Q3570]
MKNYKDSTYSRFIKRYIDLFISLISIVLLSPLFVIISIIVKMDSKGPIFFVQNRVGRNNTQFKIYKFRTMVDKAECMGTGLKTSKNDMRITRIGKILRKTSLDEIPQLINIFNGDMSIIGPRPTLKQVIDQLPEEYRNRHLVRPGITGLAQINGRQSLNWSEKVKYDLRYIENLSLLLDIKIFFKTIFIVLKQDSVHKQEISNEFKKL